MSSSWPGNMVATATARSPSCCAGLGWLVNDKRIERICEVLTDPPQHAAAGGAGTRYGMDHILARQVLRQRAPGRLLRFSGGLDRRRHDRRGRGPPLGLVRFQSLDRQLELVRLARQL